MKDKSSLTATDSADPVQGHLFIAVNCAKFRGTATSQKREFRGHFAAKIDNFAAEILNFAVISRQNLTNFVIISRLNSQFFCDHRLSLKSG